MTCKEWKNTHIHMRTSLCRNAKILLQIHIRRTKPSIKFYLALQRYKYTKVIICGYMHISLVLIRIDKGKLNEK